MKDSIKACQVVNAVGTTSVPADIATALQKYTDVESGILAWFDADSFDGEDTVEVSCVGAPNTTLGVDRESYAKAKKFLSDYDIVQTHHNHSGLYGKIIARRLGKSLISTEQNTQDGFSRKGRAINGLTNPFADRITCISTSVYNSFTWWQNMLIRDENVEIIHNGIPFERIEREKETSLPVYEECGIDADSVVVGNAAMLSEQKAHDTLVEGVGKANERSKESIEVVIAGDGKLKPYIKDIINEEGLENKVHLLGLLERGEVYSMMDKIDIYAMPSRWEGFCVAVGEAMALSTPCVLSDIEVFTELYGEAGLFHPVDDTDALADHLVEVAENKELRERMGEESYRCAQGYSMETIAEDYATLYREILA